MTLEKINTNYKNYRTGKMGYAENNADTHRIEKPNIIYKNIIIPENVVTAQKRTCCDYGNKVQVFRDNTKCTNPCEQKKRIRSGVNAGVWEQKSKNQPNNLVYNRQKNYKYYYNTSQRLKARKMSFQTNLPTKKNNTVQNDCCSDTNSKCCYVPIDKTNYGLYTETKTTSSSRTFGYRHNNSNVYSRYNTEEQKKPNKKCVNKPECYKIYNIVN